MRKDVRNKILNMAKQGNTITYGELMWEFHIPRGGKVRGKGIGDVVGAISEFEYSEKRPLISAIVVRANSSTKICSKGKPGGGFFGLPGIPQRMRRSEGEFDNPLSTEEQLFIRAEQERIWQYWKKKRE